MNARRTSGTRQRSGSRMLGLVAVATLVAAALTVGSDVHGAFAQSASPSSEPSSTPTPVPTPTLDPGVPTPTPAPTPTLDPGVPTPDPNRTFVLAWSVVRNPNPINGGPWLLLSGWRFTATFEGATVIRSHPVTRIQEENADSAWWEIEFTDGGPARAVVTVIPHEGSQLLDVQCVHYLENEFVQHTFAPPRDGNTVSFEVVRGIEYPRLYECNYIYARRSVPPTDTIDGAAAGPSDGLARLMLAILAGLVAGVLFLRSHRYGSPRR